MATRNPDGTFAPGNPGGPGRHKREKEREYLRALTEAVTLEDWRAVAAKAVEQAKGGDHRAREWLSRYLVGDEPVEVLELVEELRAELEALRHDQEAETAW
jgi:hypothetical protein